MVFTLAQRFEWVEEIKKSKFITRALPLNMPEDADILLKEIQKQPATHHCFAWKFGQNYRFSDDGEPTGTAGKPILNAIEGRDCDRVLVVITRFYGGIQLGTGGLARAYGGGAARALQQAALIELIDYVFIGFHCPFHLLPIVENALPKYWATIEQQDFDAKGCFLKLKLPKEHSDNFKHWLEQRSHGQALIKTTPIP